MLDVTAMFSWSVSTATKYISSFPIPVEWVRGSSTTHPFINRQARQILLNDGHRQAAQFFNMFADQLDSGVVWVDNGLQSTCHLYDPDTKSGMWHWPSAAEKCKEFYQKALKLWQNKKHARAMFYLGAALHLVQDVCVPHHASCRIFNGHVDFEHWAEQRKYSYQAEKGGLYGIADQPEDWIAENAKLAKQHYSLVNQGLLEDYHRATGILLPRAQHTSAGFLLHFYKQL